MGIDRFKSLYSLNNSNIRAVLIHRPLKVY